MSGSENKPSIVPFDIPADEEDDDVVFSSVLPASGVPRTTPSGGFPAVPSKTGAMAAVGVSGGPSFQDLAVAPLATLTVLGGSVPRTIDVQTSPFQIGRAVGDLKLDDPYLSPVHVQLRAVRSALMLEDLNSRNGVFLRIADELALEDFDEIAVGHQRFIFRSSWDHPENTQLPYQDNTLLMGADPPYDAHRLVAVLNNGNVSRVFPIPASHGAGPSVSGNADLDATAAMVYAMIERRSGKCFIKDLEHENGTFIRIHDPVELIEGDCFLVGRTRISVSY